VKKTVDLLKAVRAQLDDFGFSQSLAALAPLAPMQKEMETALSQAPRGDDLTLRDHFANLLVEHVKNLILVVKDEASGKMVEA
jgi:hypothetical protein